MFGEKSYWAQKLGIVRIEGDCLPLLHAGSRLQRNCPGICLTFELPAAIGHSAGNAFSRSGLEAGGQQHDQMAAEVALSAPE